MSGIFSTMSAAITTAVQQFVDGADQTKSAAITSTAGDAASSTQPSSGDIVEAIALAVDSLLGQKQHPSDQSLANFGLLPETLPFDLPPEVPEADLSDRGVMSTLLNHFPEIAGDKGYLTRQDIEAALPDGPGKADLLKNYSQLVVRQSDGEWGIPFYRLQEVHDWVAGDFTRVGELHMAPERNFEVDPSTNETSLLGYLTTNGNWPPASSFKPYITKDDIEFGFPDCPGKEALLKNFDAFSTPQSNGDRGITQATMREMQEEASIGNSLDAQAQQRQLDQGYQAATLLNTLGYLQDNLPDLANNDGYLMLDSLLSQISDPGMQKAIQDCFDALGVDQMGPVDVSQAILNQTLANQASEANQTWESLSPEQQQSSFGTELMSRISAINDLQTTVASVHPPSPLTSSEEQAVSMALSTMSYLIAPATGPDETMRQVAKRLFDQWAMQANEPFW